MEPRVSFITLGVGDLERATRFYRDVLGLPQKATPPTVAFFEMGKTWLSLYPRTIWLRTPVQDSQALLSPTTSARLKKWTRCSGTPPPVAAHWSSRATRPTGVATRAISRILMGSCGRWRGTRSSRTSDWVEASP